MKKGLSMLAALVAVTVVVDGGLAAKAPKPERGATGATGATGARGPACKAPRSALLRGVFVEAGETSFTMDVTAANAHGLKLKGKKAYAVGVDAKTRYQRRGKAAKLADLRAGDRLGVQALLCKGTSAETATLLARRVQAQPKKASTEADATAAPAGG